MLEARTLVDEIERLKAGVRAKVKHPFRTVRGQRGPVELRNRGSRNNTAQLVTLSALANLRMMRRALQVLDK
jgi:IS5 family transposase